MRSLLLLLTLLLALAGTAHAQSAAGVLLLENLALEDLVERTEVSPGHLGLDVPHGALMPRLAELAATAGGPRR